RDGLFAWLPTELLPGAGLVATQLLAAGKGARHQEAPTHQGEQQSREHPRPEPRRRALPPPLELELRSRGRTVGGCHQAPAPRTVIPAELSAAVAVGLGLPQVRTGGVGQALRGFVLRGLAVRRLLRAVTWFSRLCGLRRDGLDRQLLPGG